MQGDKPESETEGSESKQVAFGSREFKRFQLYFKLILLGIVVLILMQGYVILRSEPYTLIQQGLTITLSPGTSHSNGFSVLRFSMLSGGFNGTEGVILTVTTLSQGKTPPPRCPPCYVYSIVSFDLEVTFNTGLGPGSYWLTFTNNDLNATTTMMVTQPFILTPI